MEEYLQYMKTLRSQMTGNNIHLRFWFFPIWGEISTGDLIRLRLDVEDHAAKVSVEEQMQVTTISTLEKDLEHG